MGGIARLRARAWAPAVTRRQRFYAVRRTTEDMRAWQLRRFNELWPALARTVPYYGDLVRRGHAAERFASWDEVKDTVPPLERRALQADPAAFTGVVPRRGERTTGGSTGQPLRLAVSHGEIGAAGTNLWYARSWFGVTPADRLFLLWGHSHRLGSGPRATLRRFLRGRADALLGYTRHSAYDVSEPALRRAAARLLECRPTYLLGYAVAWDRFARVNRDLWAAFRRLRLKVAIATAESFPHPDSAALLADVFGCPVAMEYGTVETGPLAHQDRDGTYHVFWRDFFLEGIPSATRPGAFEVLVTALQPRCVPLVRYRVGDLIDADPDAPAFAQRFATVVGRCNDHLVLRNGVVVHSEAVTHAIKDVRTIRGYQVRQARDGGITLRYEAGGPLGPEESATLRRRLARIDATLSTVALERVASLPQTVAGKTRWISREESEWRS